MIVCADYAQHRQWRRMVKEAGGQPLSPTVQTQLMEDNNNAFIGWLMLHVRSVSGATRTQAFYTTFMCQCFGLSRAGKDMMGRLGYGQALRSFDISRQQALTDSVTRTRYIDRGFAHASHNAACVEHSIEKIYVKIFRNNF
jgi:hypothetical protein